MAPNPSRARLLAPTALVVGAIAFVFVVFNSGGGSDRGAKPESRSSPRGATKTKPTTGGTLPRRTYIVKPGDSLSKIATKTGIPVEKIQELNPDVDPQALVSGQKIKLR